MAPSPPRPARSPRLVILATLLAGCTPDVASTEGAGGATTATATGTSMSNATSTAASTSTSSVGSGSSTSTSSTTSTTSSSSTGSGAPICSDAVACDPEADPGCSIACPTGNVCDCDGDGYGSIAPGCSDVTTPDCFDCNAAAHPGQTAFFTANRGDGSFDYNCNAVEEPQYPSTCPAAPPCNGYKAFTRAPKCGHPGDLHDCEGILTCMKTTVSVPDVVQSCK